jgi:hypothetical protein
VLLELIAVVGNVIEFHQAVAAVDVHGECFQDASANRARYLRPGGPGLAREMAGLYLKESMLFRRTGLPGELPALEETAQARQDAPSMPAR